MSSLQKLLLLCAGLYFLVYAPHVLAVAALTALAIALVTGILYACILVGGMPDVPPPPLLPVWIRRHADLCTYTFCILGVLALLANALLTP